MNTTVLAHLSFKLLIVGVILCNFYEIDKQDRQFIPGSRQQRYAPFFSILILPLIFAAGALITPFFYSSPALFQIRKLCSTVGLIAWTTGLYDMVLLAVLPLLRKHISARVCGSLWLLPYLLCIVFLDTRLPDRPLLVLTLPRSLMKIFLPVWGIGAVCILAWYIGTHLCFRRRILQDAAEVTDHALVVWQSEQRAAGYENSPYRLVRSPMVQTPLSIGFFKDSIRVILPERAYTDEELSLVLRHELVHIGRMDCWAKFFLVLCTSICWWNPFMWISKKKSADDLELSCDETVLLNADRQTRKQYAGLLLKTAGPSKGFTTCLSASAESLRYRLKNIMHPQKRTLGALLAGALILTLWLSFGSVTLAWDAGTGADVLFSGQIPDADSVQQISYLSLWKADSGGRKSGWNEEALSSAQQEQVLAYLADLPLQKVLGTYNFPEKTDSLYLNYRAPSNEVLCVFLRDHALTVTPRESPHQEAVWYLPAELDWTYLESLFSADSD